MDVRVVKRGEYDEEVVRWADAIISAGGINGVQRQRYWTVAHLFTAIYGQDVDLKALLTKLKRFQILTRTYLGESLCSARAVR